MSAEVTFGARWAPALAALAVVSIAVVLQVVMPTEAPLERGYVTPILALELARSESDVAFLSGDGEAAERRAAFDRGHVVDMAFPFAYGGLILLLLWPAVREGDSLARAGAVFAAITVPTDIAENLTLMQLTDALGAGGAIEGLLGTLFIATWAKWIALALALAALGAVTWSRSKLLAVPLFFALPVTLATVALGSPGPAAEAMGLAVVLGYLAAVVQAGVRAARPLSYSSAPG